MTTRPLWAEISRSRLLLNYERLRQSIPSGTGLLPVVKANAYGHEVSICAPLLADAGARWLGVTGFEEGARVRAVCPAPACRPGRPRILLMSGIWPGEAGGVIEHALTPVVWESHHLDLLEEAAGARRLAPHSLPVHLEIDTGMARQGVRVLSSEPAASQLDALLPRFHPRSCLHLEGVMTHFGACEVPASTPANSQLDCLETALEKIFACGLRPRWLHAGNSSTTVAGPARERLAAMAARWGICLMLRPGLALYGYLDRLVGDRQHLPSATLELQPVLAWKARVSSMRTLDRGQTSGYGETFLARRQTRLALLPVGYADGFNRLLSNRGQVLIRGQQAPIAGRISMDQTMVDVTGVPGLSIGDEAVLIGSQGSRSITAWDIADQTGGIAWEVLSVIGSRVPRVAVP